MKEKLKKTKTIAILYGITAAVWICNFILKYMDATKSTSEKVVYFMLACVWVICAITQTKKYLNEKEKA